jgi:hypothetical protein
MTSDEIRSAVLVFIHLMRDTRLINDEVESTLPLVLDRLALASHYTPEFDYAAYPGGGPEYEDRPRFG